MRIISWNVQSLVPWLSRRAELRTQVDALGCPDVLCLQEVRIRAQDEPLVEQARTLVDGYHGHLALCRDPRNVTFRGGRAYGVVTYVRTELLATSASPAWDREGRVVVTAFPALHLSLINLYAVNGTAKPYVDPDTGEPRGDRHHYKRRFQGELMDLARDLREAGDVIVAGDWNVARTAIDVTPRLRTEGPHARARAELDERFVRDGWVDVFRSRKPDARAYTWFGRTRGGGLDAARVDYFVVNAEAAPRVVDAGILDEPRFRPRSDHAPLFLDLERVRGDGR
jgi:exodeoxyribonuclease-3